jgi:hypothetical protein
LISPEENRDENIVLELMSHDTRTIATNDNVTDSQFLDFFANFDLQSYDANDDYDSSGNPLDSSASKFMYYYENVDDVIPSSRDVENQRIYHIDKIYQSYQSLTIALVVIVIMITGDRIDHRLFSSKVIHTC